MEFTREIVEEVISHWDDDMLMAMQIRAHEVGFQSVADYIISLNSKLGNDADFLAFFEEQRRTLTPEEQREAFLREFYEG